MGWITSRLRTKHTKSQLNFSSPSARSSCYIGNPNIFVGAEHIHVGENFSLEQYARVEVLSRYKDQSFQPHVSIGNNVQILYYLHLGCIHRIAIGDGTLIGSYVSLIDHDHGNLQKAWNPEEKPADRTLHSKGPILIGKNCWIGEKATILGNVKVGDGAIIAAHALVTKDVAPLTLVGGCPARPLKKWNPKDMCWHSL